MNLEFDMRNRLSYNGTTRVSATSEIACEGLSAGNRNKDSVRGIASGGSEPGLASQRPFLAHTLTQEPNCLNACMTDT